MSDRSSLVASDGNIHSVHVVHAKTTTTCVDPVDAPNNIELPVLVGQNNLHIMVEPIEAKIMDLPIVVEPI